MRIRVILILTVNENYDEPLQCIDEDVEDGVDDDDDDDDEENNDDIRECDVTAMLT